MFISIFIHLGKIVFSIHLTRGIILAYMWLLVLKNAFIYCLLISLMHCEVNQADVMVPTLHMGKLKNVQGQKLAGGDLAPEFGSSDSLSKIWLIPFKTPHSV